MFKIGNIEFRWDNLIGVALIALVIFVATQRVINTVRQSVLLANTAFQTATVNLQQNAQHESVILDQIVAIQGRQAAVVDMEQENATKIKGLEQKLNQIERAKEGLHY